MFPGKILCHDELLFDLLCALHGVSYRTLLAELERHEEAWPFLQPVNHKQFPTYRKVIKHAMDVQAIKHKLRDSV